MTRMTFKRIIHGIFEARKSRSDDQRLAGRPVQRIVGLLADSQPHDFCARKMLWIIEFNSGLTGRGLKDL